MQKWKDLEPENFQTSAVICQFMDTLLKLVSQDCSIHPEISADFETLQAIANPKKTLGTGKLTTVKSFKKKSIFLTIKGSTKPGFGGSAVDKRGIIKPYDEFIYKIYCADHTYTSVKLLQGAKVQEIVACASEKLCLGNDPILCEVKSNGERIVLHEKSNCVVPSLSVNGRLFIAPREHQDALTPLPEQEGPTSGTMANLEVMDAKDMAVIMTQYDWDVFFGIQEQEFLNKIFGISVYPDGMCPNLDNFLQRFSKLQHWVVTEIVLLPNLGKRVQLLRKLIKLAQHLKDLNNLMSFMAVMFGLGHLAVSRLSQTWEKIPGKLKKVFSELESVVDSSRNHRAYRMVAARINTPAIPYIPLLIKDMKFLNEGSETYYDSMVNFEKMRMIAQVLRTVRYCRQQPMKLECIDDTKVVADMKIYIKEFQAIDNQKILTNLSHKCEPRKG